MVLDEEARLAALDGYGVLGAERPAALDELTALATGVFGVPVSTVSLVDRDRVWFAGNTGWSQSWTPRAASFSALVLGGQAAVVPDTLAHPKFSAHGNGRDPVRFLAGAPIVDADGFVLGGLCLLDHRPHDFTETQLGVLAGMARQAAHHLTALRDRREIERMRRREEDFVATVSHEMRTPITVMQGYLETLAEEDELAGYRPMLDPIRRNGDRLVRMVDHLLAGTELMAAPVATEPGRVDLAYVARAALGSCLVDATEAHVRLGLTAGPEPVSVPGDFGALCRATEQLVRNAILFGGSEGEVTVRVIGGSTPAIEVSDRGPGIPAAELPHVTERFYRGRFARDNAVPGVGLGLTIAVRIAQTHGGRLTIRSAADGTTVRLDLPAARTRTERVRRTLPRGASTGPRSRTSRLVRP